MERVTIDDVVKAAAGTLEGEGLEPASRLCPAGVSIDSRTLKRGDLFFALRGERYDGHDFAVEAFRKGAVAGVVSKGWVAANRGALKRTWVCIGVEDTLQAFGECAGYYRSLFSIPVIAVTGTNGKTTTKDMVAAVLSEQGRCLKTEGNFNNHIGLPLTLFRLCSEHRSAVLELGMRAAGEIGRLARMCDPQFGVITNVGPAHIQFLSSLEEIARAKGELLECLGPADTALLNGDDELVMGQRERVRGRVVTFGLNREADVRGGHVGITASGGISFETDDGLDIALKTPGRSMVYNALAAVAVGREFHVPAQRMKAALERFQPQPMRMEVCTVNGLRLINDAYNANPVSMRGAIETLVEMECAGRRIAVLGDMLELGDWALQAHRDIGKLVGESGVDHLFTVGELARGMGEGAVAAGMDPDRVHQFESREGVVDALTEIGKNGDLVLVKGSRKMGLEGIVDGLRKMRRNVSRTSVETH